MRSVTCPSDGRVKGAGERLRPCIDMSIVLLTSNVHIATSETSTIATGVHVSYPPTNMYTSLEDIVKY